LTVFRQAVDNVLQSSLQVLTIPGGLIAAAAAISQHVGLLSNDALIVAVMRANGLTRLASSDPDFDRVPGLTRYAPA
jgi:predicted nucleic acid-binding protein